MARARGMASAYATAAMPAPIAMSAMSYTMNPFAMQQSFYAHLVMPLAGTAAATELVQRAVASARMAGAWTPRTVVWILTSAWISTEPAGHNSSALTTRARSLASSATVPVTAAMAMGRTCAGNALMAIS